jgi:hypothetical protein
VTDRPAGAGDALPRHRAGGPRRSARSPGPRRQWRCALREEVLARVTATVCEQITPLLAGRRGRWRDHPHEGRWIAEGTWCPDGRPPEDLEDVLALAEVVCRHRCGHERGRALLPPWVDCRIYWTSTTPSCARVVHRYREHAVRKNGSPAGPC